MTKHRMARRAAIIGRLCDLSRNGWRDADPAEYLALEAELRRLEEKATARRVPAAFARFVKI